MPAVAAFLIDTAYGMAPLATIARMIGCYALASAWVSGSMTVEVASRRDGRAKARVSGSGTGFEVEHTVFGAAHILHEDDVLGLYILEIAPDHTIPAHCHRVMHEAEMILDNGLIQQGRPVRRGDAFDWPLGHVHAYHNPTRQPRRVLCIDSPRFDPVDEVPLRTAPPLVPLAPVINYLA